MTEEERKMKLNEALSGKACICSSEGNLHSFPDVFHQSYPIHGIGLIVCHNGSFVFKLDGKPFTAHSGETLFIPECASLQIVHESADMEVLILVYRIDPIRDIMGNLVLTMYPYMQMSAAPCYVWNSGEEADVIRYIELINSTLAFGDNPLNLSEQKLLLLSLTHRLCSIYSRKILSAQNRVSHRHEVFLDLIQLIDKHFMQERGVEFYADKLCLSPKYLSALSKDICGYTVQELVFKAIIRKSISLLTNTQKNIQEIADDFNFPNASYFGTFFKKQTGMSPQQYRQQLTAPSGQP